MELSKYIWDQECQKCPGGIDCTACYKTHLYDTTTKKAILTANCIRRALRDGITHFDSVTHQELKTPAEILKSLLKNGSVDMVDPPPSKNTVYLVDLL